MIAKPGMILLLLSLLLPAAASAACVVDHKATIPLQVVDNTIIVPVAVNGIAATFILDTGAQRSVVTPDAVQRLDLARDQWVGTTIRGIGGIDRQPNADPHSLSLGGIPLVRRTLSHDTSLVVAILPHSRVGDRVVDGLLGRDFLSVFDLDLDLPDQLLRLYQVHDCAGHFLPWTGAYASIPITIPIDAAIVVGVSLDDIPIRALLDTGASASILATPGMYRLGLTAASLAMDQADQISGLGPRTLTVHRHQFHSLRIGNQVIDKPVVWVEPVRLQPTADMLLGADFLANRRVWISFATRQLFVATP